MGGRRCNIAQGDEMTDYVATQHHVVLKSKGKQLNVHII